ncbi:hypothetical protein [Sphingobium xenophagum]|jgi:hypothetical protein|nr:hypothetical protein [Sphingobium xenophagum]
MSLVAETSAEMQLCALAGRSRAELAHQEAVSPVTLVDPIGQ